MDRKNTQKILVIALFTLMLISCEETTIIKNYTGTSEEKTYSIEGYAQKGPFIVGSNVTVSELNDDLYPTGRVFFATILDSQGHFELPGVVLTSSYIQIKVEGSYFSEVSGGVQVPGNLTLYSLADITDTQNINVNILTHLEKERVEYLVQEESKSFSEAKEQALEELLSVFNLNSYSVDASEDLSVLSDSEGNAVLLTVSSVIEGILDYERRLALITNFQNDFEDGTLDAVSIQNTLLTSAFSLVPSMIIENITTKFTGVTVPDFEPVLEHFLENSEYTNYFSEIFVRTEDGSINLLKDHDMETLDLTKEYVLFINPPHGVDVILNIVFNAYQHADEGIFDIASPLWTESNVQQSCSFEGDPHCLVNHIYRLYIRGTDLSTIEIPISSLTGKGYMGFSLELVIDGFYTTEISSGKTILWEE